MKKEITTAEYNEYDAKNEISRILNEVGLRKFGNAFRKHIDPSFKQEMHVGYYPSNMRWSEMASYIIGDGSYSVTEVQFNAFMKEFKK